jgi:nucleotide-binding universal stress UspA family protein
VKLPRRRFLHLAASAAAVPTLPRIAQAQAYPTRPVRIIVGFAPGQAIDIVTRIIGQWLSEQLGQQFIIENRPGAGGNIATEAVVRAPPDGYTLLAIGSNAATKAGVPCDVVHVEHEHPYGAIIDTARARGCDAIVMASHGRRGVSAIVLGSETVKVLTHSTTPVVVVRGS